MRPPAEQARYRLAPPVDGPNGTPFWEISDMQKDIPLATIHKSVPDAETIANQILEKLEPGYK
jgi:hypothetical protein